MDANQILSIKREFSGIVRKAFSENQKILSGQTLPLHLERKISLAKKLLPDHGKVPFSKNDELIHQTIFDMGTYMRNHGLSVPLKPKTNQPTMKSITKPAVFHQTPDVKFISRFISLDGKTKSIDQLATMLRSLQRLIADKTISLSSPYVDEIRSIQAQLVKAVNLMQGDVEIKIDPESKARYVSIIENHRVYASIPLLKAAVGLISRKNVYKEASKLVEKFDKALSTKQVTPSDPAWNQFVYMHSEIKGYLNRKYEKQNTNVFNPVKLDLQGLAGLGISVDQPELKPGKVLSSSEMLLAQFKTIPFTGKWKKLIGEPAETFKIMVYGVPGSGKSSLLLQLSHYLAKDHGKNVLYIANEEKFSHTLKEKISRLQVEHPGLFFTDRLPENLSSWDSIVFDSVNSLNLTPEDLQKLFIKYPNKSFIFVFKVTKEGKFRGSQEFEHDIDTTLICEIDPEGNLVSYSGKNRFGGFERVKIL